MRSGFSLLFAVALALGSTAPANAAPCDDLAKLNLADTKVASAAIIPPGAFHLPAGRRRPSVEIFSAYDRLPSFCRVQVVVAPSERSHIAVEIWLPLTGWNGRFLGAGNGGYAGSFSYFRLGEAINSGYVGASTDTGHRGGPRDVKWSVGEPEKQTDFDYRAIHEMTTLTKAIVRAFYGKLPDRSYFSSCSNGGRQALMEAERYPDDYDGIMAGAPAYHFGFGTFLSGRLDTFRDRGGKLIIYHGTSDAPQGSIDYYRRAVSRMGQKRVDEFIQLYLVPGMRHCGGGEVPNDFGQWLRKDADPEHSMLKALERWVENGVAPTNVIATQYRKDGDVSTGVLKTRPLCPYPRKAVWNRSGNKDAAENYSCSASASN
ncbi:MAG TPA: tannase/feruloyl esterase family alpha/beta hydrolase [Gemmatimonadaceae bacterium]|nr:tannase/feruloyl esterase family alpha/beta hydrolase [Gemmatimonadaceae bacterium]